MWLPINHAVATVARERHIPLVISTHGMAEPWALQHRAWKKRLAWLLYQKRDLQTAAVLYATSEMEFLGLRRIGLRQPIAVIPNGVALPEVGDAPGKVSGRRTVLFLGRIHPVKGLLELVNTWRTVRPAGWRVVIAGPDEGGHRSVVEERVRRLGLRGDVEFVGPVDGAGKAALYRSANLFVLPTFSENFGVVVAEALAHGVPVITTRGAPWADLETFRCGWWIDVGVEPLEAALREAFALTDEDRAAMGARGREYVKRFDWQRIAEQTLALYRWILGQGERPDCVRLE
jgi:glycosyltransferase involved in cell wall biosynthesis